MRSVFSNLQLCRDGGDVMFLLLGEKNVRIVDVEKTDFPMGYDAFFGDYQKEVNYRIIVDRSSVDFSIDTLKNCNIIDAHRALRCRRKITASFLENTDLIPKDKLSLFKKEDFYMQTISATADASLYAKLDYRDGVFLMEHIIAEFCGAVTTIDEKTWWLYVAEHKSSGIKIVSGMGKGIVVSRIIPLLSNCSAAVLQTIRYLKRFGLKGRIKIVSPMEELNVGDQEIDLVALGDEKDPELMLIKFLSTKNIRPVFAINNYFRLFLKNHLKKIYPLWGLYFFIFAGLIFYLQNKILEREKNIFELKKSMCVHLEDLSRSFRIKIDDKNFLYIQQVIKVLEESKNPLTSLKRISDILKDTGIAVEMLSLEGYDLVKLKCVLNRRSLEKLQKLPQDKMKIQWTKINGFSQEYEEIDESHNKNFSAEICIKMK
jgi:hypothetical protein